MSEDGGCSTNAWNQNFSGPNAGNQNNDNKSNTNRGARPVRRLTAAVTGISPEVTTAEVLAAYLDCRKNKRGADTTTYFELDLVANVTKIARELRAQEWHPGTSMCFAVTVPKVREIWAAQFYDRVVHHVIYNRLRPRLEPRFIATSFACIPGRGTLAAKAWAERAIRRVTAGWSREAYALQLDVASFFPTIDQRILLDELAPFVEQEWLWTAIERVYSHRVTDDVHYPADRALLAKIPPNKSLWHAPEGKGLPIGNLTSQFGANVYLNVVDQHVTRRLRPRFYGRYVDDLLLFDTDKVRLLEIRDEISQLLHDRLALELHPGKTRLQSARHGVDFVGYRILPHRTYLRRRTATRALDAVAAATDIDELLASINSYLGIAGHANSWRLRKRIIDAAVAKAGGELVASKDRTKLVRTSGPDQRDDTTIDPPGSAP